MKKITAFTYYGGKNAQLSWLLPLLPYTDRYVEPFGGSAAVLLNRERSPVEVYNDLDNDVVNFFRVLREQHEKLIDLLYLTPYSKTEHKDAFEPTEDPLESARRFFVRARQSFIRIQSRTWSIGLQLKKGNKLGSWTQMAIRWLIGIDKLESVVTRLTGVHIECRPAIWVIQAFDDRDTFQYLDPPYMHEARTSKKDYTHEMTREDHEELLHLILSCESKIAISSYDNSLYSEMLRDWFRFEDKEKSLSGPRGMRQEILYTNYDPKTVVTKDQTRIDDFFEVY